VAVAELDLMARRDGMGGDRLRDFTGADRTHGKARA
jgi:hypothetical protein